MVSNDELRRRIRKGDPRAMCFLAMREFDGFTCKRNPDKGLELVQEAMKLDSPYAKYFLAYYYRHYEYTKKRDTKIKSLLTEAGAELKPLADEGDEFAAYCYAMIHRNDTVKESKDEVMKYFAMAADQGLTEAQYELGRIYRGIDSKHKKALELIFQAADKGYPKAQKEMGDIYSLGKLGITANPLVSYEWYMKAATNGNHVAMRIIGDRYLAAGNKTEGDKWMKKAKSRHAIDN